MAAVGDVIEATPAIGNFLVLGERVGDQREGAQVLFECVGQRQAGLLALFAVGVLQQRKRGFKR
jgi:hypothetical protein